MNVADIFNVIYSYRRQCFLGSLVAYPSLVFSLFKRDTTQMVGGGGDEQMTVPIKVFFYFNSREYKVAKEKKEIPGK